MENCYITTIWDDEHEVNFWGQLNEETKEVVYDPAELQIAKYQAEQILGFPLYNMSYEYFNKDGTTYFVDKGHYDSIVNDIDIEF